jgi:hypothetical protein
MFQARPRQRRGRNISVIPKMPIQAYQMVMNWLCCRPANWCYSAWCYCGMVPRCYWGARPRMMTQQILGQLLVVPKGALQKVALAEETAECVNRIALLRLAASLVRRVSHSLRIDAWRLERLLHDGLNLRVERAHCLIAKQDLQALPPPACTSRWRFSSRTHLHTSIRAPTSTEFCSARGLLISQSCWLKR